MKQKKYMNPYLGGALLGLVLVAAFWVSGRGLGASGASKSAIVAVVKTVSPSHAENTAFYKDYLTSHPNPLKEWLVFQMLGVIVGGFISGAIAGRLKFKVEKSPKITNKTRIIFAVIGGIHFWFWIAIGSWLYQRIGTNRNGSTFAQRFFVNGCNLRNSICTGLFCPQTLDIGV